MKIFNDFLKKVRYYFNIPYEYSSEKNIYDYVNSKIIFNQVEEIYLEYFGHISMEGEDYKKMTNGFDFNIRAEDKFYVDEGSLIAIYSIKHKDGQIYQFIKRYLNDYTIYTCYFRKIDMIPITSFKRNLIYKDNYFYDCYNFNTQQKFEKLHIKEIILFPRRVSERRQ